MWSLLFVVFGSVNRFVICILELRGVCRKEKTASGVGFGELGVGEVLYERLHCRLTSDA